MPTITGTAVNFGVSGTAVSGTGVGTMYLQKYDRKRNADMDATRDEDGNEVSHAWHNYSDEASLEYKVKGSSIADAATQTKIPEPGALVTITSSKDSSLAGTTWEVQSGPSLNRTNTSSAVVTLPLKKFAGITSVAS